MICSTIVFSFIPLFLAISSIFNPDKNMFKLILSVNSFFFLGSSSFLISSFLVVFFKLCLSSFIIGSTIKTSLGISNGISGLTTSTHYGTRVEDEEICLNVPDVANILAIYESSNSESPILDKLVFSSQSISGAIVGEKIYGSLSEAVGQITDIQGTDVSFVYLNSNKFQTIDVINFEESKISTSVLNVVPGVYINKTNDFTLDKGQKDQYYDYSKIVRNIGSNSPAKKLLVVFDYFEVSESDSGDLYTVNSYNSSNFKNDVPILKNESRSSDVLDFRPRVNQFTGSAASPFDFSQRNFGTSPKVIFSKSINVENESIGSLKL